MGAVVASVRPSQHKRRWSPGGSPLGNQEGSQYLDSAGMAWPSKKAALGPVLRLCLGTTDVVMTKCSLGKESQRMDHQELIRLKYKVYQKVVDKTVVTLF